MIPDLSELQNRLASSDPWAAADARRILFALAQTEFPNHAGETDSFLEMAYDCTLYLRDGRHRRDDRYWLEIWYIQQLFKQRKNPRATPTASGPVGAMLTFLADEVDKWDAAQSKHSPEIIDNLTEMGNLIFQHHAVGEKLSVGDLKRLECLAINIAVGLEIMTGDVSILLRYGNLLKNLKRQRAGDLKNNLLPKNCR
jgi:hypothetical protein